MAELRTNVKCHPSKHVCSIFLQNNDFFSFLKLWGCANVIIVRNGLCPISMVYRLLAPITFADFDKCDLLQHFLESTKVFQEYTAGLLVTYTSKRVSIINEKKLIPFRKYFLVDLTYECQAEI